MPRLDYDAIAGFEDAEIVVMAECVEIHIQRSYVVPAKGRHVGLPFLLPGAEVRMQQGHVEPSVLFTSNGRHSTRVRRPVYGDALVPSRYRNTGAAPGWENMGKTAGRRRPVLTEE